jgi:hypothetical protein
MPGLNGDGQTSSTAYGMQRARSGQHALPDPPRPAPWLSVGIRRRSTRYSQLAQSGDLILRSSSAGPPLHRSAQAIAHWERGHSVLGGSVNSALDSKMIAMPRCDQIQDAAAAISIGHLTGTSGSPAAACVICVHRIICPWSATAVADRSRLRSSRRWLSSRLSAIAMASMGRVLYRRCSSDLQEARRTTVPTLGLRP